MGVYFIDQYSLLHFSVGVICYFWGISFMKWMVIHALFELIENTQFSIYIINNYVKIWPGGKTQPDSIINSLGDISFGCIGWYLAKWLDEIYNWAH